MPLIAIWPTVNLQELRKDLGELRTGLGQISKELKDHFEDVDSLPSEDGYPKIMWRFVADARDRLSSLVDKVTLAESSFEQALQYFGEDAKAFTSTEFFGVFKIFVTSYNVSILCEVGSLATTGKVLMRRPA